MLIIRLLLKSGVASHAGRVSAPCTIQPELGWIVFLFQKHLKVVEVSFLLLIPHIMFFRTDPLPSASFSKSCSSQGAKRRPFGKGIYPWFLANTPGIFGKKSVSILSVPQWGSSSKTSSTPLGSQKGQKKGKSKLLIPSGTREVWLPPSQTTISRTICKESSKVINLPWASHMHSLYVNVPWQSFPFPFSKWRVKVYKPEFLRSLAYRARDVTCALHCFKLQLWSLWGHPSSPLGLLQFISSKSFYCSLECWTWMQIKIKVVREWSHFYECEGCVNKNGIRHQILKIRHF